MPCVIVGKSVETGEPYVPEFLFENSDAAFRWRSHLPENNPVFHSWKVVDVSKWKCLCHRCNMDDGRKQ